MKKLALLVACALALTGCVHWSAVGGKYVASSENYEADLPTGWRKHNLTSGYLVITRDGIGLQQIAVGRWPIDKEPPHTKRKFAAGMLPQEAAELVIDDFRSDSTKSGYEVTENLPANVGGHPGFRIAYSYRTKSGLKKKGVYYGALRDKALYYCFYEAPATYYFAKDYETFEKVKNSLRITS